MKTHFNWGIIGAGHIADKFASDLALLPEATLLAIGTKSAQRGAAFASRHTVPKVLSYSELLSDPSIDIVYIASRHIDHYRHSLDAINHGKAVLCEKPAAMNRKQLEVIIKKASERQVFYMEALWTRFLPSFVQLKQLLASNCIGERKAIEADFHIQPPMTHESRLFNPAYGGGALLDIGLYPLFFALEIGGPVEIVHAVANKLSNGVDTTVSILLKHKNNLHSVLTSSLETAGRNEATVYGTNGCIKLNSMWHTPTTIDIFHTNGSFEHHDFDYSGNGYQYEAAEVMKCLAKKRIKSSTWSWNNSLSLMTLLDIIREKTGISYAHALESV